MTTIISIIICLISSRNSILNSKIASRSFLLLRIMIFENKDLRDNEDLEVKAVNFVWAGVKLSARDWI